MPALRSAPASCAGRGCWRARRAGSAARPSTPARRSPGACARAAGRAFPPGLRDAPLLGGTVIDLLAREQGERAAARFACRLHPQGPRAALTRGVRRALAGAHRGRVALAPGAAGQRPRLSRRRASRQRSVNHQRRAARSAARRPPAPPAARPAAARGRPRRPGGVGPISSAWSSTSRAVGTPDIGHQHVARAGGQEVRHVEAGAAAQHAGHALLEQQPLDELGLGLVARPRDPDQLALGQLRLDLARALVALGDS